MTDQYQNTDNIPSSPITTPPIPNTNMGSHWKSILNKTRDILLNTFNKVYSHKKLFWPLSISLGLMFIIVVLGLLFGKPSNKVETKNTPTPTPINVNTPEASISGDILSENRIKLDNLKKEILNLDVDQNKLKPPSLDFDIKF